MANKTIHELTAASNLTANDELAMWDVEAPTGTEPTKKVTAQQIAATVGDILDPVTGVKGNSESNYRTGNVNITKANIGLGNVDNTSDADKPVSTAMQTALDAKASVIVEEITTPASVMSFPDGAEANASDLVVGIEPVQDLHGYDHPWPAGSGKNLLKPYQRSATASGVTYSVADDGKITLSGTATSNNSFTIWTSSSGATVKETGLYTVSMYGAQNAKINGANTSTLSVNADTVLSIFTVTITSGTVYNESFYVQIEAGSAATDYTPYSNICPITGWTGVEVRDSTHNLFCGTYLGLFASGTADPTKGIISSISGVKTALVPIKGGMTYAVQKNGGNRFSVCESAKYPEVGDVVDILYNTQDQSANLSTVVTTSSSAKYLLVYVSNAGDEAPVQVEFGSTVTTYAEGTSTTYPISWQTEAGTVYGGTLDVTTGLLTVDKAEVDLSSQTISRRNTQTSGLYRFAIIPNQAIKKGGESEVRVQSNVLRGVQPGETYSDERRIENSISGDMNSNYINFFATDKQTVEAWQSFFSQYNVQAVYELATPQTYQLTPTQVALLLGQNNIWADTGNVQLVEYQADTKLYINKVIAALAT